jgi:hypothetical protein
MRSRATQRWRLRRDTVTSGISTPTTVPPFTVLEKEAVVYLGYLCRCLAVVEGAIGASASLVSEGLIGWAPRGKKGTFRTTEIPNERKV